MCSCLPEPEQFPQIKKIGEIFIDMLDFGVGQSIQQSTQINIEVHHNREGLERFHRKYPASTKVIPEVLFFGRCTL
jgi:hypothetical protein